MSFPRYPAYKESGVEWLGEVPEHWLVVGPKRIMRSCSGGTLIKGECADEAEDGLYPAFSASGQDVWVATADYRVPGIVLSAVGARCGKTFKADGDWSVVANTHCLFPDLQQNRDFFWYLTNREDWWEKGGTAQPFVKVKETLDRLWCIPPQDDQLAIASFLDHETAKIDALIAEQQRLIELLQEKRQAVISHAVTKGLNPEAPMKDSGVEWLGEVPEHWDVAVVGHKYSVQLGKMLDSAQQTGDHSKPYLRVADVQWDSINTNDLPEMDFPPHSQERYLLKAGDLLVNEGGSYVGRAAIWEEAIEECYYQKSLHRLRAYQEVRDSTHFMYWLMEYATKTGVFIAGGNQTTIDHLTAEQLRKYRFGFPSLEEQVQIADYVRLATGKLLNLTKDAENLVKILQERRSALISAAVTGQIDVRGYAPEAAVA